MNVLVLDNYDSFTYNLVHFLENASDNARVEVFRNDKISLDEVGKFDKIVLSPGPGLPSEAGIMLDLIKAYSSTKPILGICLGHQAIAEVFGGTLINLENVVHGIATPIHIVESDYLFQDLPTSFSVGRYHSWVVQALASECIPLALDNANHIMAFRHANYDVRGVQFHPESILTENGLKIISNWINN